MSVKTITENLKTGNFSSLYYIYGDEEYLKQHYAARNDFEIITRK